MLAKRIIPCLDVKNGRVVKGTKFQDLKDAGDPVELGRYYAKHGADELMFLDISATQEGRNTFFALVEDIAETINIPFSVGGGLKTVEDIRNALLAGADKVSLCTAAVKDPAFVREAVGIFGSQCIVISIDAKRTADSWNICIKGGTEKTEIDATEFAAQMNKLGAGELLVNSLDNDGTMTGYDIDLLKKINEQVTIPVIASSGAGNLKDFYNAFEKSRY